VTDGSVWIAMNKAEGACLVNELEAVMEPGLLAETVHNTFRPLTLGLLHLFGERCDVSNSKPETQDHISD
jgi:hypothetical protein